MKRGTKLIHLFIYLFCHTQWNEGCVAFSAMSVNILVCLVTYNCLFPVSVQGRIQEFLKGGGGELYTTDVTLNTNGVEGEWQPLPLARSLEGKKKFSKGGLQPPQPLPWIRLCCFFVFSLLILTASFINQSTLFATQILITSLKKNITDIK